MTLFFILLIALFAYQFATRKSLATIYPQFNKVQLRRLTNVPFYFAAWTLLFVVCAQGLSALTAMIAQLFNIDMYIGIFGGGWLGLILQLLRAYGFIDDIQEPAVLIQYKETISLVCNVTLLCCVGAGTAIYDFCRRLKRSQLNSTAILAFYYLSMACGLISFLTFMWALWDFNDLLNHAIDFHMEEVYIYLSATFIVSCTLAMYYANKELKALLALPQCKVMTWQQVLAKFKIKTDKGQQPVTERQLIGIFLGLSLLVSGYVVLRTLPAGATPEETPAVVYETTCDEEIAAPPAEEPVNNDESDCIAILNKYYNASREQIKAYGGRRAFETERFIQYTSHFDYIVLTSNQDFGIGDECLRVEGIVPNANLANSYIVTVSCGHSAGIPTCVVMKKEGDTWKIDNIAYEPYDKALLNYSLPASGYNAFQEEESGDYEIEETPAEPEEDNIIYGQAEVLPSFPGGQAALMQYLSENVHYPAIAKENGVQGRVICLFVVEKDGSISNLEVVRSGGDPSLDNEALRVLQAMPKWTPGQQKGRLVRVKYTIPINFKLN